MAKKAEVGKKVAAGGKTAAAEKGKVAAAKAVKDEAKTKAPAGKGKAPAAKGNAPAVKGNAPAAKGKAPAAKGNAPALKAKVTAAKGKAPAAKGNVPAAKGKVPAVKGKAPAAKGNVPAAKGKPSETKRARGDGEPQIPEVPLDILKPIFQAAGELLNHEPWDDIEEDMVFGIEHPGTGEIYYCGFTGSLGDCLSMSLYRGVKALGFLYSLMTEPDEYEDPVKIFFSCDKLEVTYVEKEYLDERDRELARAVGLPVKSDGLYPSFRVYRPGYHPWYFEADDSRFFLLGMNLVNRIFEDVPDFFEEYESPFDTGKIVVFRLSQVDGNLGWDHTVEDLPDFPGETIEIEFDEMRLHRLAKKAKRTNSVWELGAVYMREAVLNDEGRPFYPIAILWVDKESGIVVNFELATNEGLFRDIQEITIAMMEENGLIPAEIHVGTEPAYEVLRHAAGSLGITLQLRKKLKALESALEFMATMPGMG